MSDRASRPAVLDTTVLSNFAHINHVSALFVLPFPVTVAAVENELKAGTATHPYLQHALTEDEIPVVTPTESVRKIEQALLASLDRGEAQAIAVAAAENGIVVTDDGDARTIAKERGVPTTGSIGVLVRAVDSGVLTVETADNYLTRWIDEAGFRSPARDITVFLDD